MTSRAQGVNMKKRNNNIVKALVSGVIFGTFAFLVSIVNNRDDKKKGGE